MQIYTMMTFDSCHAPLFFELNIKKLLARFMQTIKMLMLY